MFRFLRALFGLAGKRRSDPDDVAEGREQRCSHSCVDLFVLEPQRLFHSGTEALAGEGSHVEQVKILLKAVVRIEAVAAERAEIMGRQARIRSTSSGSMHAASGNRAANSSSESGGRLACLTSSLRNLTYVATTKPSAPNIEASITIIKTIQARSQTFSRADRYPHAMKPTKQSKIVATNPCASRFRNPVMVPSPVRKASRSRSALSQPRFQYTTSSYQTICSKIRLSLAPRSGLSSTT